MFTTVSVFFFFYRGRETKIPSVKTLCELDTYFADRQSLTREIIGRLKMPPSLQPSAAGSCNIYYGRFETLCNSVLTSEPDKSKSPWNFYHFNLTTSGFERSIYLFTRVRHEGRCVLSKRSAVRWYIKSSLRYHIIRVGSQR